MSVRNLYKGTAVLVLVQLLIVGSALADDSKKLIWGNIPFVKAGNYLEFEAELAKSRAVARREMLGEFASLMMPLALSSDDVARLARVIASIVIQFDALAREHAEAVHEGIPVALSQDFKAGLDRIYAEQRLTDNEQRTGIASRQDFLPARNKAMSPADALKLVRDLRFTAYGSYTVMRGARVRATLNLEDLVSGRVKTFSAEGPIDQAGGLLATKVMDFLQGVEYPNWENPQPQLTWVAPPFPQSKVRAQLAAQYCEGQHARLPYASELAQAALAGNYRKGGIGPLFDNATYIVADRNRSDEQYYYSTSEFAQTQTGGPLHTSAGQGTVVGYFWCVRGAPAAATLFDQAVYRLIRENRYLRRDQVVGALEYVLAKRNDLGSEPARVKVSSAETGYYSLESATKFLADNGVYLWTPAASN